MKKIAYLLLLAASLTQAAPNDMLINQRNSVDSGTITRTVAVPSGSANGLLGFNGATVLPVFYTIGQGLQISSGVLSSTATTGPQGPKGDQGIQGVPGPAGATGAVGAKGDQGAQGAIGATGAAGPKGDQGIQGTTGLTGAAGSPGAKGDKGDTGSTGLTGPAGPAGVKGDTGSVGATGSAGVKGDTGNTGPQGPIGLTGATGLTGAQGPIGLTGAAGAKGDTGSAGTQGIQGLTGATGPQGPSGISKRIETYTGTTNATGQVIVTYPTAFSAIPNVQPPPPILPNQVWTITSSTTTGFTAVLSQRNTITLLSVEVLLGAVVPVSGSAVQIVVIER